MLLRPTATDVRVIGQTTSLAILMFGGATAVLAVLGLMVGDVASASALGTGGAIGVSIGLVGRMWFFTREPVSWSRGVVAATFTWMCCSLLAAVPLYLSGHYGGFLDAHFEAMSGLTTTGLTLVQDIDHMAPTMAIYRHGLELAGGLAIVIVGMTLLTAASATATSLSGGDARDERIMPNLGSTIRVTIRIIATLLCVGIVLITSAVLLAGVPAGSALLHGLSLAVAASTTGGFSIASTSVGYYHSPLVEITLIPIMIGAATSFLVMRKAMRGDHRAAFKEVEVGGLLISMAAVIGLVLIGLASSGAQVDAVPLFRHGVFAVIAAHTTTGFTVAAPRLISTDWGQLAPAALVTAMTVGGMAASTAGGFKLIRVGVIFKGLIADIQRVLLPESALVVPSIQWGRRRQIGPSHLRAAASALMVLIVTTLAMSVVILYFDGDVNLTEALFVTMSAATNAGQSLGTLTTDSHEGIKLGLSALMLLGRLEWMAVFSALGFVIAAARGRV